MAQLSLSEKEFRELREVYPIDPDPHLDIPRSTRRKAARGMEQG